MTTIDQTTPLIREKIRIPVVTLGGNKGLGDRVCDMISMVAEKVDGRTLADHGHFLPEEAPDEIVRDIMAMTAKESATGVRQ